MPNINKNNVLNQITDINDNDVKGVKAISVIPLPTHVKDRADELKQRMVQIVTEIEKGQGAFGVINKKLLQVKNALSTLTDESDEALQGILDRIVAITRQADIGRTRIDDGDVYASLNGNFNVASQGFVLHSKTNEAGHELALNFDIKANRQKFIYNDSFVVAKQGQRDALINCTVNNNITHINLFNPRCSYSSGITLANLTDSDVLNYGLTKQYVDQEINKNNTDVVTPIDNRVEALEMLTSGIEVIGNSYYVDKTIVVQDLNGNYKDIYLARVQLQKKATNNLDAVRFDQFTDTITNTTSNVKKYTDDKISTFENEKYKPLNKKVTNLETSQQFHAAQYEALNKKVTDFLNVSNADLDTLSELIAHLQNNSGDIESIFSALTELRNGKLNISDFTQWRDGTYATKVNSLDTSVNNLNVKTNNLDTRLSAFENDSQIMNFSQPYEEGDNLFIDVEFNLPILGVSFDVESGELILQHN